MVCAPVRLIIPSVQGLSLCTDAQTMLYLSHVFCTKGGCSCSVVRRLRGRVWGGGLRLSFKATLNLNYIHFCLHVFSNIPLE